MTHPLEWLGERALRLATAGLFAAWAALTLVMVASVPAPHLAWLAQWVAEGGPATLGDVDPAVRASAAFVVGFDFLYDLVHNHAVACAALLGARWWGSIPGLSVARAIAWAMWLCSALNLPENLWVLDALRGAGDRFPIAARISLVRFVLLWSGFAGAAALLWLGLAARRRRESAA